jgi:hypothetical protein
VIDIPNHDPNVGDRKLRRLCAYRGLNTLESGDLREKETLVFPGQLDEVASVPKEFEAQRAIERDRPLDVADDDLANELLGRVDVSAFRAGHLDHGISARGSAFPGDGNLPRARASRSSPITVRRSH